MLGSGIRISRDEPNCIYWDLGSRSLILDLVEDVVGTSFLVLREMLIKSRIEDASNIVDSRKIRQEWYEISELRVVASK